ncbi:adenylyl-sulfate kinase [Oceanobacillus zhaokaii]|uniref:Adenylyl-sulfate kinase n=1 Tax=Oceanobacillus zhaokaii TaxID=2052660 RepID=A0A345PJC3_9BACI|nr:adenylyl-sulfate kinase [Oceanobacillus zhaokaii]AXI10103.1 adenylyl-sulfate kinase [Oceanobacillus zhaokaii]
MSKDIQYHSSLITSKDRQHKNNHKSKVLWLTGLSGTGKSTLAVHVERELHNLGVKTYILDGDNLRFGINSDLRFSDEDRKENIRRIAEISKLFVDAGIVVLVAAISPFSQDRQQAREKLSEGEFVEIYVKCSLEECERRDPKGLYKKARAGEITSFTGISSPYEEPLNPEIIVESDKQSIEEMVQQVLTYLKANGLLETED